MVSIRWAVSVAALACSVRAQSSGRDGHGMIGHGIPMYEPECAHACRGGSPRAGIDCGDGQEHAAGHHGGVKVTPECMAVNEPWLKTVAYCIYTKCATIDNATLEFYWQTELISRHDKPQAKWSYQESLRHALEGGIPTEGLEKGGVLNRTVLVNEDAYLATANGNTGFRNSEIWHVNLNLIILLTGAGIPILLSLLRLIPFPETLVNEFYAYVVDPPVIGSHHNVPVLKNMVIVPTRGQALFLLYITILNIVASFAGLDLRQPNSWWHDTREEFLAIYSNRVGMLSFANLPLLILYAGRNNILLWLTNWSHSTFLLLHRWIAFICILEAVIHSAIYLDIHLTIYKDHSTIAAVEYWYWGIVATLALVLMIPLSILPLRQRLYEVFHAAHIVLAIVTIVGCWYHIIWRYQRQWGYEVWVIIASVVWAFDWVMRAIRIARNGVMRAHVSKISEDYLRVDVLNLDAHGHVYLYFPSLNWRLWESHPFSVIGHSSSSKEAKSEGSVQELTSPEKGIQANLSTEPSSTSVSSTGSAGVRGRCTTFFIRLHTGTTIPLAAKANCASGIPVLVESSYGHQSTVSPHGGLPTPSAAYPNLVTIAGGVGITAALPILDSTRSLYASQGSKKLWWGVRSGSEALVSSVQNLVRCSGASVDEVFTPLPGLNRTQWADVDVKISVGERLDLRSLLEAELSSVTGTVVFACGPAGLADDVRAIVTALGRHGALLQYVEEAFAW